MAHSQSSAGTYLSCQKRYELQYIDRCTPEEKFMPHLEFGSMAHKVLEDAGRLRDSSADEITDYTSCIPSESSYPMLKDYFNIMSWERYFSRVCKRVAQYEEALISNIATKSPTGCEIYREKKYSLPSGYAQPHTGIIDFMLISNDKQHAIICDYKFSSRVKTQDDFDYNCQLYVYAYAVNQEFGVPIKNIQIGYIDIIKQDSSEPVVLASGALSKSKSQNVLLEDYIDKIIELELDIDDYREFLDELRLKDVAYISLQEVNIDTYNVMLTSYMECVDDIERKRSDTNCKFLRKIDSFSCSDCPYKYACRKR